MHNYSFYNPFKIIKDQEKKNIKHFYSKFKGSVNIQMM